MKKCLCLLLSLTMLCLCAGAALAETVALKVWGSQEDQELLAELCEAFAAEHPETTYEFTYGVVGEAAPRPATWRTPRRRPTCSPTPMTRSSTW